MQILRVPPHTYNNITVELYTVPSDWPSHKNIMVRVTDMADSSISGLAYTAPSAGDTIMYTFSGKYDTTYKVEIFQDELDYILLLEDYYEIVRPYVNPNDHGTTATEIEKYKKDEELARAIIDSICDVQFYYKKKVIQTTGQGLDYLPIWVDAKKVLKVYENNVLLYDSLDVENSATIFEITPDGSAITMQYNDAINRDESARILLPASPTDITELDYSARGFPKGWDYTVVLEVGYNTLPSDIVRATELLIHDIDCGKLDYYKRYIGAYNTDQFRIQFDKAVFEGTGNLLVDKILDKYRKPIEFVGVL